MNDNDADRPNLQKKELQESRDCFNSGGFVILHASTLLRMVRSTIFASSPALAGPSALGEWHSDSCSSEKWTKFFPFKSITASFPRTRRMPDAEQADPEILKLGSSGWIARRSI